MKKQIRVCILACLLIVALLLSSCAWFKSSGKLREDVEVMMDALIADDFDAFYAKMSGATTEENARAAFPKMREYLNGVTTYELELNHVSTGLKNGEKYRVEQYRMETNVGVYFVEIKTSSEVEGIASFWIANENDVD